MDDIPFPYDLKKVFSSRGEYYECSIGYNNLVLGDSMTQAIFNSTKRWIEENQQEREG